MQDLLIQQRQICDVSKMVEKDTGMRALNLELGKKTEQNEDLKVRLRQLMAAKGDATLPENLGNRELVQHLQDMLKARDQEIEKKESHINQVLVSYEFAILWTYRNEKTS